MSPANVRISTNRLAVLVAFFLRYRLLFLIVWAAHIIPFNSLSINARCCWPSFITLRAKHFILGHSGRSSSWKPAGSSIFTWSETVFSISVPISCGVLSPSIAWCIRYLHKDLESVFGRYSVCQDYFVVQTCMLVCYGTLKMPSFEIWVHILDN